MQLVAKDPPDYLCLHYYSTSGDAAIKYIRDMHAKFNRPVVSIAKDISKIIHILIPQMVTEIASTDRNYPSVLGFTIQLCNWMDTQDWIFEYGLFDFQRNLPDGFVSPDARLMNSDGSFTQLGNMYLHDSPMKWPTQLHLPGTI